MKTSSKIKVLIPDGESHVLSYVVNCFAKSGGVELYVMSDKKNNYMRFSKHIKKFLHHTEREKSNNWIKVIDENVDKYNIDIILPIFEKGIEALIKHKYKLKNKHKLCSLPNSKDFTNACNKEFLHKHLVQYGALPYPESIIAKSGEIPDLTNFNFPIIAKPVEGSGGGVGIKILRNPNEVLEYCKNQTFKCNIIFQEYITGFDVCSNVLCENGEVLACTMQKGVAFEKGEVTYQVVFNFIEDKVLYENTRSLMKSLNWSGVANIDWRYDTDAKAYKVIEVNPRYWYNTDASAIAGINFPYLSCLNFLEREMVEPNVSLITYYNLKGLIKKIKKDPFTIFKFNFLKKQTPLFFALRDPLPIAHKLLWRTKNILFGIK